MQIYLPIAEMPVSVLLILGLGLAIGFISGMFGIGGGFLMTPLLIFLGIPAAVAVATQSAQVAAAAMSGALSAWRKRAFDPRLSLIMVIGGFIGSFLGVLAFNGLKRAGQLELTITLAYVSLFLTIGSLMLADSLRGLVNERRGITRPKHRRGDHPWYTQLPWRMRFPRSKIYVSVIPLGFMALLIGFIGAILGIGGGLMLVPALIYLFRVPTGVVVGTSQMQMLCAAIVATLLHAMTNQLVDIVLATLMIVGGVVGAQFGARAGQKLKGEFFRLMLAVLVLSVGLRFALDLVIEPRQPFTLGDMESRR